VTISSAEAVGYSPAEPRVPECETPGGILRIGWASLVFIGAVGGVLSGLFAIGGAILMVPLLMWRAGMDQRQATATSLVAIIPTAVVSSIAYMLHSDVDVVAAGLLAVGAMLGALLGSRLLNRLPLDRLRWIFIAFLLLTAAHMLVVTPERGHAHAMSLLIALGYIALGLMTGVASGLFGIGGAIVAVPLLVSVFAVGDLAAKGTALLVSVPTSLTGTVTNRRRNTVDIREGLILGATAAATSIPAVLLAVAIPPRISGILFAALLIAIAAQLAYKAVRTRS
jgi:uncharacterized membrane protein YfcA